MSQAPQVLDSAVLSSIRAALPISLGTATADQLQLVYPPVPITSKSIPLPEFEQFEKVPVLTPGSYIYSPSPAFILENLKVLAGDIQVGKVILSEEQVQAVDAARKILFVGPGSLIKSSQYLRYLEYEQRDIKLRASLTATANSAARASTIIALTTNDKEWELYGARSQISEAIATVASADVDDSQKYLTQWRQILTGSTSGDYSKLWDALAESSDWTAITVPVKPPQSAQVRFGNAGKSPGTLISQPILGLSHISFKYRLLRIPRPALDHPFLRATNWRSAKSYVLSSGANGGSSDLVPLVPYSLVLIKGLEFTFGSQDDWGTVSTYLDNYPYVTLAGFPLKSSSVTKPFASPKYLSVPQPYVIAVVVRRQPKTPNPDSGVVWPRNSGK